MKITNYERKNYILKDKKGLKILSLIKKIEKYKLNKKDKEIIRMARTQLKRNWETPLINYLTKFLDKLR